jgi:glycosyltransferase involved in cell wall biosynthesis
MKPLVSCVVAAYNAERFLPDALNSILEQDYEPREVLVCDDGSSDRTWEVIASYGDRVRAWRQPNQGPCAARNLAITHATGEFLAFLDADDLWAPDKLSRQMARFDRRPELDYCVCHVQNFVDPNDGRAAVDPAWLKPIAGFSTVALLVRRPSFERIGGFNPSLKHSSETDWFARADEAGAVGELLPDVLVNRRLHRGNRSRLFAGRSKDEYLHTVKAALDRRRSRPGADV